MSTESFPVVSTHSPEELRSALAVIRTFKACEDDAEWFGTFFVAWQKLEQLERYLEAMTREEVKDG